MEILLESDPLRVLLAKDNLSEHFFYRLQTLQGLRKFGIKVGCAHKIIDFDNTIDDIVARHLHQALEAASARNLEGCRMLVTTTMASTMATVTLTAVKPASSAWDIWAETR